jgi:methyl-accepting chemotaxis protein
VNWTIGKRLFCIAGAGLAMVAATCITGYVGSQNINAGMARMGIASVALRNHMECDMSHDAIHADVMSALASMDKDGIADAKKSLAEDIGHLHEFYGKNMSIDLPGETKAAETKLGPMYDAYVASAGSVIELAASDRAKAQAALPDFLKIFQQLEDEQEKLSAMMEEDGKVAAEMQDAAVLRFRRMVLACGGVALALLGGIAYVIARKTKGELVQVASKLGEGSNHVATASGQVASSSQGLAQGASEQAAALEETTSALEEMASMTVRNADAAGRAATISAQAKAAADKGNEAMTQMTAAIDAIQTSADQTAKILKTIDEIAFQTNLLALNAAVEAARAGEAGKGFAVVAEEVRNLAIRSAEAAKNTASLIDQSVSNARNGVQISTDVAKTLSEITAAADQVNGLIAEIASASQEQSQGVKQINTSVSQMDKVTQGNAASAEESASAAEQLSGQAQTLQGIVRDLGRLVGTSTHATARRAA